ncbi:potassium channel, subfamily K, member 16-like [Parasteatoda tepidariorum]|uniref:potassium channel, subfamily K, member 16-like n=1 Tax=Parasteatoda tepidariorum TaxID=114398 RepID=UPI001C729A05|nr:potassium channel subfamily K member 16-like [Parasteatoda tepidariorum]
MWNVVFCYSVFYTLYLLVGGAVFLMFDGVQPLQTTAPVFSNQSLHFKEMKQVLLAGNYTAAQIKEAVLNFYPKSPFGYFTYPLYEDNLWWTFFNCVFFCYQMLATIGYGGITPHSPSSQMFAIFYVILGVPLCTLFNKVLGQSYAESQNEMIYILRDKVRSKYFMIFLFYAFWALIFYFLPSAVFLHTEHWSFLDGVYYTTTTAATSGLGDFLVGQFLKRNTYFAVYRLLLLAWMVHAVAFFAFTSDALSRVFSRYLLYELHIDIEEHIFEFRPVYVNPESLDVHFRLMRAEKGVQKDIDIWRADQVASDKTVYLENHFKGLILATENLKSATESEMRKKGYSVEDLTDEFKLE